MWLAPVVTQVIIHHLVITIHQINHYIHAVDKYLGKTSCVIYWIKIAFTYPPVVEEGPVTPVLCGFN